MNVARTLGGSGVLFGLVLGTGLLAGTGAVAGPYRSTAIRGDKVSVMAQPDSTAIFTCELAPFDESQGLWCYGPDAIRKAYGVFDLINAGIDGKGETIVLIEAFGSPTAAADLQTFDEIYSLPDPPSFEVITMPGGSPIDLTDPNQEGWAEETSLDIQWSHAIAPGAKIIVVVAPSNSDVNLLAAQNFAIDHNLGHIMSESFGQSELALLQEGKTGKKYLNDANDSYRRARHQHISVLVSAGDDGASSNDINGNLVPVASPDFPASSPNVTTVGGTNLFFGTSVHADPNGTYQGEIVWSDGFGVGGGGISLYFNEPNYQNSLSHKIQKQLNGKRGYPDVAYNAGVVGGVIVFLGFLGDNSGFYIFGGTSAGAPQWAAMAALGNQLSGTHLGFLNSRIYSLANAGILQGLTHDITIGNNDDNGVTGFDATKGWDLTTGWGTPNFGKLLKFLCDYGTDDDGSDDY
jgi:subtilase family serine protease